MAGCGFDGGFSFTKCITPYGHIKFPSRAGQAVPLPEIGLDIKALDFHLLKPKDFFVGRLALQQRVGSEIDLSPDWFRQEEYLVWYLTALGACTSSFKSTYFVVAGLPIGFMDMAKELEEKLCDTYLILLNGASRHKTVAVRQVKVIAQGIGAHLAELLDDNGNAIVDINELKSGRAAILDIGGKTTNMVSAEGIYHVANETQSIDLGVWDLENEVRQWLFRNHDGWGNKVPRHTLVEYIKSGSAPDGGKDIDLIEIRKAVTARLADKLLREMYRLWGDGRDFRKIHVCGGGAPVFIDHIKSQYHGAKQVDNPQMANVLGFFRLAQFLDRHRKDVP